MESARDVQEWVRQHARTDDPTQGGLLDLLLEMQRRFGYLPRDGLLEVAARLDLPPAHVYGVATFYNAFRFSPPGRRPIRVCTGTACHIRQSDRLLEHAERRLGIRTGETTADGEYGLERVACVGCCALAPVMLVGDEVIGKAGPARLDGVLLKDRLERPGSGPAGPDAAREPRG